MVERTSDELEESVFSTEEGGRESRGRVDSFCELARERPLRDASKMNRPRRFIFTGNPQTGIMENGRKRLATCRREIKNEAERGLADG